MTLLLLGIYAGIITIIAAALAAKLASISSQLHEAQALRQKNEEATAARIGAETKLESLSAQLQETAERLETALAAKHSAERETALARQQVEYADTRMKDWETTKAESVQAAKASISEAGAQLSSKLLEDHKREAEAHRKQQEEATRKTTENLLKEFTTITKSVASLNDQVTQNRDVVSKVWKALSTPAEVGYYSEIGLENSLKAFGLLPGRDFHMQYSVEGEQGGRKRPDAVIFLPHDTVMVVDSKASRFVLEIAEALGSEAEPQALANLKRSMREHLRILSGKDYKGAVLDAFKQAGKGSRIRRVLNVMYLPNESTMQYVQKADPEFPERCVQQDIIPAGPTGLAGLIGLCRIEIDLASQAENQEHIIDGVQDLLESVATVLGYAQSVGKGLKSATESFSKFSRSINTRLLPRSRKLETLGVRPARNKTLPHTVQGFTVLDEGTLIEGEADTSTSSASTASPRKTLLDA